jgi:hypothetical protein
MEPHPTLMLPMAAPVIVATVSKVPHAMFHRLVSLRLTAVRTVLLAILMPQMAVLVNAHKVFLALIAHCHQFATLLCIALVTEPRQTLTPLMDVSATAAMVSLVLLVLFLLHVVLLLTAAGMVAQMMQMPQMVAFANVAWASEVSAALCPCVVMLQLIAVDMGPQQI